MRYRIERNEQAVGRSDDLDPIIEAAQFEAVTHPHETVVLIDGLTEELLGWWQWDGDPADLVAA